ncbi:DUF4149 domain-containing protein [Paludibaculum fermentans]|uniref:DUF4149 domain-containing protein n=1 Tax=Paludibaculum fermentans TaxID=1473598 RepID=A0A7S7NXG3_PALFE|nr:DUF4149 domain-containing protein [Paludibaculum fermentans]QOY91580.1 DUF4149 domain-containing protein [Paludibaculum fermentans]
MANQARMGGTSSAHDRISHHTSWATRRITAVLLSIWIGGILLVSLVAPAGYRSVDSTMARPPQHIAKAMQQLGQTPMRDILQYQASEANRVVLEWWGLLQMAAGLSVFLLLLFMSTAGRPALGISLGMLLMSLLEEFFLIPRISQIGQDIQVTNPARAAEMAAKIRALHLGFTAFEMVVVLLGAILLGLLLRSRPGFSGSRSGLRGDGVEA